ncbi:MAG: hypothetical protein U9R15_09145 [Chloroflexota bacterium]|nr:hypothetical protein [Chloroflexota bacterium]
MNTNTKLIRDEPRGTLEWVVNEIGPRPRRDLSQATNRELATLVVERVKNLKRRRLASLAKSLRLKEQNAQLTEELTQARRRLAGERIRSEALERAMEEMRSQIERDRERELEPLYKQEEKWQKKKERYPKTFEREANLLQILAETGMSRRAVAAKLLAEHLGVDSASGSIGRAFSRLEQRGWIELIEVRGKTAGSGRQQLVRLTDRGVVVCERVLDLNPVPSQLTELLSRHRSPSRVLLILQAAELLREVGYTVNVFPDPIASSAEPRERALTPDLAASWRGATALVLVEGGEIEDVEMQRYKWQSYYDVTDGALHVVTPSPKVERKVRKEIRDWAHSGSQRPVLALTNISDARGKGLRGDEVWKCEFVIEPTSSDRA